MRGTVFEKSKGVVMKDAVKWIVALILIWVVGSFIMHFLFGLLHWAIIIGFIALFAYIVYAVYKASQRQKI